MHSEDTFDYWFLERAGSLVYRMKQPFDNLGGLEYEKEVFCVHKKTRTLTVTDQSEMSFVDNIRSLHIFDRDSKMNFEAYVGVVNNFV